jgi:hypothetical protein
MYALLMVFALASADAGPNSVKFEEDRDVLSVHVSACDGPEDAGRELKWEGVTYRCAHVGAGPKGVARFAWGIAPQEQWQPPPWVYPAGMLALAVAFFLGRMWSRRLRNDGDPSNDWIADMLDLADEAWRTGDVQKGDRLFDAAREAMKTKKAAP